MVNCKIIIYTYIIISELFRYYPKPCPMKKIIPAISAISSLLILFNSCSTGKNTVDQYKSETIGIRNISANCFVEWDDGKIQHYTSLKLVTGILTTPHLLANNKIIIHAKDVMAYQDMEHYAVSSKILNSTKKSMVAADALPGFAIKVVSGKLNVYSRKYYNGANTVNEYFLQQGQDGFIVAYSKAVLKSMLQEDKRALEYFNKSKKISPESKRLLATVEMYNNNQFVTKN